MTDAEDVGSAIAALIAANRPDAQDVAITSLSRIVGGNSAEIWRFDASWAGEEVGHPLILRRSAETEFGSSGRAAEFRLLRSLEGRGVPAPAALWLDGDGAVLGRPAMVLERLPGKADRNLLRDDNRCGFDSSRRHRLAGQMADILASIHGVDVGGLDLDDGMRSGPNPAARQLAFYDAEIARDEVEPMPELRLASLWLAEHLPPPPARRALVHGDYRPANLLVDDEAVAAVLDWEFAHEGDPAEDLGWFLSPYYTPEHFPDGLWTPDDFIARYEAASGTLVDRAAAHFWSVFAMYKLASMTMAALAAAVAGDVARLAPSARFIVDPLLRSIVVPPVWTGGEP